MIPIKLTPELTVDMCEILDGGVIVKYGEEGGLKRDVRPFGKAAVRGGSLDIRRPDGSENYYFSPWSTLKATFHEQCYYWRSAESCIYYGAAPKGVELPDSFPLAEWRRLWL